VYDAGWYSPRDASKRAALCDLERRGFAERQERATANDRFRITAEGRAALERQNKRGD
jgi:DNA-binding PadR family transcriptional regulator